MIPRTASPVEPITWQSEMSRAVSSMAELLALTGNSNSGDNLHVDYQAGFPLRVPRPYIDRIENGNSADPLLRQVLPVRHERSLTPGYVSDPLMESQTNILPGIIHKYVGRVLLILAGNCAINCRYCFRKHFPYDENNNGSSQWEDAIEYIRNDTSITEVILSGGEPLLNNDKKLASLCQKIAEITHVKRLRIHTRMPIVVPQRITNELLDWMTATRLKPVMVIHCNHSNELDDVVAHSLALLKEAGINLLNQSVLLAGVNDNSETLLRLSERLFECGVMPYYLHLLDRVSGSAHFEVDESDARQLLYQLSANLPGYLVPKLVREIAGKKSKTPIVPVI